MAGIRALLGLALILFAVACTPADTSRAPGGPPTNGAGAPSSIGATAASSAATASPAGTASEPARPAPVRLRVAYTAIGGSFAPAWLAHDLGLFAEQGLASELTLIGSTEANQALVAGDLDLIAAGANSAVEPALAGADTVLVGAFLTTLDQALVTLPNITRPEQLRGTKIGVAGARGALATGVRLQVRALGLDPQRDITVVALGNPGARLAAMAAGVTDGAGLAAPATLDARRAGYYFWDKVPGVATVDFVPSAAVTRRRIVAEQRDVMVRALRALARATAVQKYDRARSFPVLAKYFETDEPEALEEAFAAFSPLLIPDLRPNLRGLQTVLEFADHPDAGGARPEQFVDLSLLDDLEREGFFTTLPRG
jgi:NitT/TauT family transport system substrate-binding protein